MVCSVVVVFHLVFEGSVEIEIVGSSVIEDTNESVYEFNLFCLSVRDVTVVEILTDSFQDFTNFGMDQCQQFTFVTLDTFASSKIVPPFMTSLMTLFRILI